MNNKNIAYETDDHDNCYLFDSNYLTQISYDLDYKEYKLLRIQLETMPDEKVSRTFAITYYKKEVKEKHSLPYNSMEYSYISAFELKTKDMTELLEYIVKE